MASLWREVPGEGWKAFPATEGIPGEGIGLISLGRGAGGGIGLLARAGTPVRVNGLPVAAGFRVLEHRDEILIGRTRLFFSAESTPVQVEFRQPAGTRPPTCPVCRGPIRDGDQAVRCPGPGCGLWYHQQGAAGERRAKPCWTYAQNCRFCNHPTALSGKPGWRPEMEEANE
jgi:hypothetical protein